MTIYVASLEGASSFQFTMDDWDRRLKQITTRSIQILSHTVHNHEGSKTTVISDMMMEAICSSETSVLTRATWHHIPEDSILQFMIIFITWSL
jgi:hypothetical protein